MKLILFILFIFFMKFMKFMKFIWYFRSQGMKKMKKNLQMFSQEAGTWYSKIRRYFRQFWNQLDCSLNFFLLIAVLLRLRNRPEEQNGARVTYSLMLMLWFLRFMEYFYVSKVMGPKIIMIQKMVRFSFFSPFFLNLSNLAFGFSFFLNFENFNNRKII